MRNYMKSVFAKHKPLIIFFAVFGALIVTAPIALGINRYDEGWQIDAGSTKAIAANTTLATWFATATNTKMIITNSSAASAFFIPTRTAAELVNFVNNHPAVLGVVSYCGNRACEDSFGENCGNCPSDCGFCNRMEETTSLTNLILCGDGRCDFKGESSDTCPKDCGLGGYCVPKNSETPPNCDLHYVSTSRTGTSTCNATRGCYNGYKTSSYVTACTEANAYVKSDNHQTFPTDWPSEKRAADCWVHEDKDSCTNDVGNYGTRNCFWIGQPDTGGKLGNYCGDGVYNLEDNSGCFETVYAQRTSGIASKYSCGDHVCNNSFWAQSFYPGIDGTENIYNCPKDCGTYNTDTGMINSYNGCGNGVCAVAERKGQATYCAVDCGDIGEGLCRSFKTVCLEWETNNETFWNMSRSLWESCTGASRYDADGFTKYALNETSCNKARNKDQCNRYGCYWDMSASSSQNIIGKYLCKKYPSNSENREFIPCTCGNGTCDGSETTTTCPRDCGFFFRSWFCEGPNTVACATKNSEGGCKALASSGCDWVER